jgi:hypothetical protein
MRKSRCGEQNQGQGRRLGWMAGWLDGWMAGWLDGWMAGWLDGWMAGWLDGWMAGWLDGWMGRSSPDRHPSESWGP